MLSGLSSGYQYSWNVSAWNVNGGGPPTAVVKGVPGAGAPAAPTEVRAVQAVARANGLWNMSITWLWDPSSAPAGMITSMTVVALSASSSMNTSVSCPAVMKETCWFDGLPVVAGGWFFRARAENGNGKSAWSALSTMPCYPQAPFPGSPQHVTATAGNGVAHVSWKAGDNSATIQSYAVIVHNVTDSEKTGIVMNIPPSNPAVDFTYSADVGGLVNNRSVTAYVIAYSCVGINKSQDTSPVTPGFTPPSAARTVIVSTSSSSLVNVSWSQPLDDGGCAVPYACVYFYVWLVYMAPWPASDAELRMDGAPAARMAVGVNGGDTLPAVLAGPVSCCSAVVNLDAYSDHAHRVFVFGVVSGNSAGNNSTATVSPGVCPGVGAPSPPTSVTLQSSQPGTLSITWDAVPVAASGGSPVIWYDVMVSSADDATLVLYAEVPVEWNSTQPTFSSTLGADGLQLSHTYCAAVRARSGRGASANASASTCMQVLVVPPSVPLNAWMSISYAKVGMQCEATCTVEWAAPIDDGCGGLCDVTYSVTLNSSTGSAVTATGLDGFTVPLPCDAGVSVQAFVVAVNTGTNLPSGAAASNVARMDVNATNPPLSVTVTPSLVTTGEFAVSWHPAPKIRCSGKATSWRVVFVSCGRCNGSDACSISYVCNTTAALAWSSSGNITGDGDPVQVIISPNDDSTVQAWPLCALCFYGVAVAVDSDTLAGSLSLLTFATQGVVPPSPPLNLSTSWLQRNSSARVLQLNFETPEHNGGLPFEYFLISAVPDVDVALGVGTVFNDVSVSIAPSTLVSTPLEGLVNGQMYSVAVQAANGQMLGPASLPVRVMVCDVPDAPSHTRAEASILAISLFWTLPQLPSTCGVLNTTIQYVNSDSGAAGHRFVSGVSTFYRLAGHDVCANCNFKVRHA
jgi:hypothetical protein